MHGRILPYGCGIPVEGELARGDGVLEGSNLPLEQDSSCEDGFVQGFESFPRADFRSNGGDVFSLEVLTVNGHEKRGAYVGSHLHLNVTYLAQANPDDPLKVKPDENSALRWVPLDDAVRLSSEPWIRDRIYRKLIAKTRAYANSNLLNARSI